MPSATRLRHPGLGLLFSGLIRDVLDQREQALVEGRVVDRFFADLDQRAALGRRPGQRDRADAGNAEAAAAGVGAQFVRGLQRVGVDGRAAAARQADQGDPQLQLLVALGHEELDALDAVFTLLFAEFFQLIALAEQGPAAFFAGGFRPLRAVPEKGCRLVVETFGLVGGRRLAARGGAGGEQQQREELRQQPQRRALVRAEEGGGFHRAGVSDGGGS